MTIEADAKNLKLNLSDPEKVKIGQKIFHNECSRKKEKLTWWNAGEDFASIGLGHFIWFPRDYDGPFNESFVDFVNFLKDNSVDIPLWLAKLDPLDCPWTTKEEFFADFDSPNMISLREFIYSTFTHQVDFIIKRVEASLYVILSNLESPEKELLYDNFFLVFNSPDGVYALIDYINFKGEGISSEERYNGLGWGLTQVLLNMDDAEKKIDPVNAFTQSAKFVLKRRVENAPKERNEKRWLPGWINRVNTYIGIEN